MAGQSEPSHELGVALLADDDLAAVHPDAEGRQNAELLEIRVTLLLDHAEHRVDRNGHYRDSAVLIATQASTQDVRDRQEIEDRHVNYFKRLVKT